MYFVGCKRKQVLETCLCGYLKHYYRDQCHTTLVIPDPLKFMSLDVILKASCFVGTRKYKYFHGPSTSSKWVDNIMNLDFLQHNNALYVRYEIQLFKVNMMLINKYIYACIYNLQSKPASENDVFITKYQDRYYNPY